MQVELLPLQHSPSGTSRTLRVMRFGSIGARPKAYIQAALHADELPGVLTAHELAALLAKAEATGALTGEVVLVPAANPIGLAQEFLGVHHGRFALADGQNFNRGFADLSPNVISDLAARATDSGVDFSRELRNLLSVAAGAQKAQSESAALKAQLLALAVNSDVVLDLHCDGEAVMHCYTLPSLAERLAPLARLLGAKVCLTASESGDGPFDEACSRPWQIAADRFPGSTFSAPCLAATIELRGERDVSPIFAKADARAIFDFLQIEGIISGDRPVLSGQSPLIAPLAGVEPLLAPCSGVLVFTTELGATVDRGDAIATLVDPVTGQATPILAGTSGLLFARAAGRWASAGKRVGKIAGTEIIRSGKLLSP